MNFLILILLVSSLCSSNDIQIKRIRCGLNSSSLCNTGSFLFFNKSTLVMNDSKIVTSGLYLEHKNKIIISLIDAQFSTNKIQYQISQISCEVESLCILFDATKNLSAQNASVYKIEAKDDNTFIASLKLKKAILVLNSPVTDDGGVYIKMLDGELSSVVILKVLEYMSSLPVGDNFNHSSVEWEEWRPCVCLNRSKFESYRTRHGTSTILKQWVFSSSYIIFT